MHDALLTPTLWPRKTRSYKSTFPTCNSPLRDFDLGQMFNSDVACNAG